MSSTASSRSLGTASSSSSGARSKVVVAQSNSRGDEDTESGLNLLLTFGVVPLIAVGATWLYDKYTERISSPKTTAQSRPKGDVNRTGSFEDLMRSTHGGSHDANDSDGSSRKRASSSFFMDESCHGDPKGRESQAYVQQLATEPSSAFRRMDSPSPINVLSRGGGIREGTWTSLGLEQPLVVAMVGLPARGKSYIVKMIIRFLSWSGFECKMFNVGSHRRKIGLSGANSNFFDDNNSDGQRVREEMAMAVQNEMYKWLHESMSKRRVAFFDATNTTVERRLALAKRARSESTFLLFVESICDDEETLSRNYALKLLNDDYKRMDPAAARADFMKRVAMYQKVYETIVDTEDNGNLSYIKMINVGQKMITRNCSGYVPSQISFYLQNVHIHPRKIFLSLTSMTRVGSSEEATSLQYGESANLTSEGRVYSQTLAQFCEKQRDMVAECAEFLVLSGASRVHAETLFHLRMLFSCYSTPLLNEMRGGDLHGLSRAVIKKNHPQEYQNRAKNKLNYRFPGVGGESYLDIIERVRPVVIELERQRRSVLAVCHIAVLRCIYAYLMGTKLEEIPYLQFKAHHVYEITPGPFGATCVIHDLSTTNPV